MIQADLQEIGSAIATPLSSASERKINKVKFPQEKVDVLEKLIDELDAALPPLTTFILPGGGKCSAHLHLGRVHKKIRNFFAGQTKFEIKYEVFKNCLHNIIGYIS